MSARTANISTILRPDSGAQSAPNFSKQRLDVCVCVCVCVCVQNQASEHFDYFKNGHPYLSFSLKSTLKKIISLQSTLKKIKCQVIFFA